MLLVLELELELVVELEALVQALGELVLEVLAAEVDHQDQNRSRQSRLRPILDHHQDRYLNQLQNLCLNPLLNQPLDQDQF